MGSKNRDRAVDRAVYAYERRQHERAEGVRGYDAEGRREIRERRAHIVTDEQISDLTTLPLKVRHR